MELRLNGQVTGGRPGLAAIILAVLAAIAITIAAPATVLAAEGVAVWRVYNRWTGEHLFTTSRTEYDSAGASGWTREGEAWRAPATGAEVYRLNNPWSGDHHYTMDRAEYDRLGRAGWRQEGVAFHSAPNTGKPVYRLFNPYVSVGTHHYTTSIVEYAQLGHCEYANPGWRQERTCWYALGSPDPLPTGWIKVEGTLLKTTVSERAKDWMDKGRMPRESRFDSYLNNHSPFEAIEFGTDITLGGTNKYGNYSPDMTTDFVTPSLDFTDYSNGQRLTLAMNQYKNHRGVSWGGAFSGLEVHEGAII